MKPLRPDLIGYRPGLLSVGFLLLAIPGGGVHGQDRARIQEEENLRAEPQGTVIGRLLPDSRFDVVSVDGRWVQIEVEGWMWTRSLQVSSREGFDLSVSADSAENLRAEPSGPVLAHLLEGALLERLDDVPGWSRVRRVAWVWGPSVALETGTDVETQGPEMAGVGQGGLEGWWRSGSPGTSILTGPDGDTLAQARGGTELQVLARQGSWMRVRLEGWVWAPSGETSGASGYEVISGVTPDDVAGDPEAFRGQVVAWELQFVSQEEAERVRTDFYEGEPFLLTRSVSPGRAFVYVAIPPERLDEIEGLIPLERIRVVGRIRTGAAALTGNPILDLLELSRLMTRTGS